MSDRTVAYHIKDIHRVFPQADGESRIRGSVGECLRKASVAAKDNDLKVKIRTPEPPLEPEVHITVPDRISAAALSAAIGAQHFNSSPD